jgi:hypothetical protein
MFGTVNAKFSSIDRSACSLCEHGHGHVIEYWGVPSLEATLITVIVNMSGRYIGCHCY